MSPSPDIANMIRQRNIMDQLQQTTGQGTQAAMINPGISQFRDPNESQTAAQQLGVRGTPGAVYKAVLTGGLGGAGAAGGGLEAAMAKAPGVKQINQAEQNISKGISNRIQGVLQGKQAPPVSPQEAIYGPVNPPTMKINPQAQLKIDPATGQIIKGQ